MHTTFYYIPKEKVANILKICSSPKGDGKIVCNQRDNLEITLSDYIIPENIITTPSIEAYIGKIGTQLEWFASTRTAMDIALQYVEMLKEYEV